ncbi:hypothetical protein Godav_003836 [Gossypium davidsonii]|uniref:Aminopeptidase NAALADL1 n=2 Tax=Gossypium TaxID=3633 RepID=A0A7J8SIZ0_GOSDV|nr:hypothetical protein [Gossypium davidsonii]MBA0661696.1 hypothetical protein [Gossypium klotzschianum]
MLKTTGATFLAIATSFFILLFSPPPKSYYHSLFISSSLSDNASISHHLRTLTRRPHVAGSQANAEAASYVLSTLSACNIKAHIVSYDVLLTYPDSRSLTLTPSPSEPPITFDLKQKIYEGDPYAEVADEVLPTNHAYAKSGSVVGPVVYVNYGRVEDYGTLKEMGVNVIGTVVLARYGEIYRGDIVMNAFEAGAIGALVYTDRKDYGGGGGDAKWFPDDKWMPPSGVQVGTVYNGSGDPTTPGWASSEGCERVSIEEVESSGDVPLIPSMPISGADGETILRSIGGQIAKDNWQGSIDAPTYRVGPGPGVVNLDYNGKQVIAPIQNVMGVIEGVEEPDRFVILGNHRDAWTFGAVDPNSGTAALLEVAQRLQKLQRSGWKPRRTIILCNWDAEEYGLTGSTEWVEENRDLLASRAVAYLNVDCAVSGAGFHASGTPQLDDLLKQAAQQVQDPDNSSQTIYEQWIQSTESSLIGRLGGAGSDYAAFLQHIGVPAADMRFGAVASVWGLVALRLADEEFLPFNYHSYALELQKRAEDLENEISVKGITFSPLFKSIEELSKAARKINNQKKEIKEAKGWTSMRRNDHVKVRELNDRLMMAERAFTDRDGLLRRPWYKHLIYAPSRHNDYGSTSFPGIDDAIENAKNLNTAESWHVVQHEVWRVARAVKHASLVLDGKLT